MRGEGTCTECPEDSLEHPQHCIHLRLAQRDYVCCWCGDLFMGDDSFGEQTPHGEYLPKNPLDEMLEKLAVKPDVVTGDVVITKEFVDAMLHDDD